MCSVDLFYSKLFALLRAEKLTADLGITPIVTLGKQLLNMIGKLVYKVGELHCKVTIGYNPRRTWGGRSSWPRSTTPPRIWDAQELFSGGPRDIYSCKSLGVL